MNASNNELGNVSVSSRIQFFEQLAPQPAVSELNGRTVSYPCAAAATVPEHISPGLTAEVDVPATPLKPERFSHLSSEEFQLLNDVVDGILATLTQETSQVNHDGGTEKTVLSSPLQLQEDVQVTHERDTEKTVLHSPLQLQEEVEVQEKLGLSLEVAQEAGHVEHVQEQVIQLSSPLRVVSSLTDKIFKGQNIAPEELASKIQECRGIIAENVESGKKLINEFPYLADQQKDRASDEAMRNRVQTLLDRGVPLKLLTGGMGGARIIADATSATLHEPNTHQDRFIIKANDEDVLHLNNPKNNARIFGHNEAAGGARKFIDRGREAERCALAYDFARTMNMAHITPRTTLAVLTSTDFHDILDDTNELNDAAFVDVAGAPVKTKLCSVQKFEPDTISLQEMIDTVERKERNKVIDQIEEQVKKEHPESSGALLEGLIEKEIENREEEIRERAGEELDNRIGDLVDHQSFQETFLFSMLIGECDGNPDNIRFKRNPDNPSGPMLMFKVDNGLTLPSQNTSEISTWLVTIDPLMQVPLSEKSIAYIRDIPLEKFQKKMAGMGFDEGAINAMTIRVTAMQAAVEILSSQDEAITSEDISSAISQTQKLVRTPKDAYARVEKLFGVEKTDVGTKVQDSQSVQPGGASTVVVGEDVGVPAGAASTVEQVEDTGVVAGNASSVVYGDEEGDGVQSGNQSSVLYTDEQQGSVL